MSSFKQVLSELCQGAGLMKSQMIEVRCSINPLRYFLYHTRRVLDRYLSVVVLQLYSLDLSKSGFTWMDAYLAEGLLGMSIFLVKVFKVLTTYHFLR